MVDAENGGRSRRPLTPWPCIPAASAAIRRYTGTGTNSTQFSLELKLGDIRSLCGRIVDLDPVRSGSRRTV